MAFIWDSSIGWFALPLIVLFVVVVVVVVFCFFQYRTRQTGRASVAQAPALDPKFDARSINEERLQLLQNATSDGIWDWNALTNEVYWSNNSYRMIGYEPDELDIDFEVWKSLVHPHDLPKCLRLIEESAQTGKPLDIEYRYRKKDGELLWVKASGYCVEKDHNGKATRMIGCHIDLSERKIAEKTIEQKNFELAAMNKDLIASNKKASIAIKTKDEFLSIVSHELRTPLNPIIGFSELLVEESSHNEELLETARAIHRSSLEMLGLIDDMLDYLRIQKHDFSPSLSRAFLQEVMDSCMEEINSNKGPNQQLSVKYDAKGLVPIPEDEAILIDQQLLRMVTLHLLANAFAYSNGKEVTVRSGFHQTVKNTLRIEIIDQGIGIAKNKQSSIFDALYQVDSGYSRPYEGLGLGLAICKKVIEVLEGDIGVVSEVNKGSTFWIEIPVLRQKKGLRIASGA